MKLKKLMEFKRFTFFFSLLLLNLWCLNAQKDHKAINDTITYSEENTNKILEFGNFIQNTIHENKPEDFITKLNINTFFDRMLNEFPDIDKEDEFVVGFLEGLKESINAFPAKIIYEVETGSYYDFISYRYDYVSQTYFALFRLYSLESGMNYHDYKIQKVDGDIMFSDMYIYTSGEFFTNTLGRILSYSVPMSSIANGKELDDSNNDSKTLIEALLYNKNGRYEEAYYKMNSIDSELSKEKFFLVFKTMVASQLNDQKYLNALEDLMEVFPDDPTIALNKIDYYIFKEQYFKAIQVINQLQNETEDDFLNFMKGAVAFLDQNYDLAYNMFSYTIENYPGFFDAQAGYLNVLIMMERYPEATEYLDTLLEEGYEKSALIEYIEEDDENGVNILEAYLDSEIYKDWKFKKD